MTYIFILFSLTAVLLGCTPEPVSIVDDERGKPLITTEGKAWRFSDYRGKWVIVNYWASWCKPCITEVPELEAFYQEHKDKDAIVVGVNYDFFSAEETATLREKYAISYPVLPSEWDPREQLGVDPIMVLPSTFIISPEGKVSEVLIGEQTKASLEEEIKP